MGSKLERVLGMRWVLGWSRFLGWKGFLSCSRFLGWKGFLKSEEIVLRLRTFAEKI